MARSLIIEKAAEHINDGDLILTYSHSNTLIEFFKDAAKEKKIRFEVIVCETAPGFEGHKTAKQLAELGI
jgi:translation initiation factor 2B subunit (eIF-2B alpha/beta/delta family)